MTLERHEGQSPSDQAEILRRVAELTRIALKAAKLDEIVSVEEDHVLIGESVTITSYKLPSGLRMKTHYEVSAWTAGGYPEPRDVDERIVRTGIEHPDDAVLCAVLEIVCDRIRSELEAEGYTEYLRELESLKETKKDNDAE